MIQLLKLEQARTVLRSSLRLPPPIARTLRLVRSHLPPLNFITLHYAYFIGVCLLASIVFWGSSTPSRSVNYVDSLFLVVSGMTLAGLNTINLSELNTFQQFILFVLILLGSAIWVSIAMVYVRRKSFERKFKSVVATGRQRRRDRNNSIGLSSLSRPVSRTKPEVDGVVVRGRALKSPKDSTVADLDGDLQSSEGIQAARSSTAPSSGQTAESSSPPEDLEANKDDSRTSQAKESLTINTRVNHRISFAPPRSPVRKRQHGKIFSMQGIGARQNIENHPLVTPPLAYANESTKINEESGPKSWPSFLSSEFTGRNSQFAGLSLSERERLGGVEYRALSILAWLVPAYFVLWQFLGCIGLAAYVAYNQADVTRVNAENPWYDQIRWRVLKPWLIIVQVGWCI